MKLTIDRFKNILENNPDVDIYTFISDRGGWKTSSIQIALIDNAINHGEPFILVRTKKDEYISDSWFSEFTRKYFIDKKIDFVTERINTNIVRVSAIVDSEKHTILYGLWLSIAEKYKSNYFKGFEKVRFLIWEECIPNKRISQNIKNVIEYHSDLLLDILSIASTVARNNRIQYIFIGNDIEFNIINSITVSFDILERLSENCEIVDCAKINGRKYKYYFNYFSFSGAVNHWLINIDNDINNSINIKNINSFNIVLKSHYKSYYLYSIDNYVYITEQKNSKVDIINNIKEFFIYYDELETYNQYDLETALSILYTYKPHLRAPINEYFGNVNNPIFHKTNKTNPHNLINLYELSKMRYSDIVQLSNFSDIKNFINIMKKSNIIYSNIAIKLLCEQLKNRMIFE